MLHHNPIASEPGSQKFITFGEIMLRLTPPNYEKIRVASSFEASYGGSEAKKFYYGIIGQDGNDDETDDFGDVVATLDLVAGA